jgi:hypothetical protein
MVGAMSSTTCSEEIVAMSPIFQMYRVIEEVPAGPDG